jgi:hypothetical protein
MADFEELKVFDGCGPWHLNRFRIAFECPTGMSKNMLAANFVGRFPQFLNSPYATTEVASGHTFEGKTTLKFWGSLKILGIETNYMHHDWVFQAWKDPSIGFTAQTLKRTFIDPIEDAAVGAASTPFAPLIPGVGSIPVVGQAAAAGAGVETNRKHFLAGRRSWRLDTMDAFSGNPLEYNSPPASGNLLMLETVAIERFSDRFYQLGDKVMGLEKTIPPIWISNLENFVRIMGLKARTGLWGYARQGWQSAGAKFPTVGSGAVSFFIENFPDEASLNNDVECHDVLRLYPTILPSRS